MVKMLNTFTHTEMYVAEDRVNEYLALGHKVMKGSLLAEIVKDEAKPIPRKKTEVEEASENLKKTIRKTKRKKA